MLCHWRLIGVAAQILFFPVLLVTGVALIISIVGIRSARRDAASAPGLSRRSVSGGLASKDVKMCTEGMCPSGGPNPNAARDLAGRGGW